MEQIFCSIPDAARRLSIGRSSTYELIGSGALGTVKIGQRRLVVLQSLEAYARSLIAKGSAQ